MTETIDNLEALIHTLPDYQNWAFISDVDDALATDYLASTEERLEDIEANALEWESNPENTEFLEAILRQLHTIKGDAGFVGLGDLGKVVHSIETCLGNIPKGQAQTGNLLIAKDWLSEVMAFLRNGSIGTSLDDSGKQCQTQNNDAGCNDTITPAANLRILIAVDDFISQQLVMELSRHLGDCHLTGCGKSGVDAFQNALEQGTRYDLVCLVGNAGEISDSLAAMRSCESTHNISSDDCAKVIVLTGFDGKRPTSAESNSRCESYLHSPIMPTNLTKAIRNLGLVA